MGRKITDIVGKKFGKLTVINLDHAEKNADTFWKCRCDCGNTKIVAGRNLKRKNTKSCGCLHFYDLTGHKFGRLLVIKRARNKKGKTRWKCLCNCGNTIITNSVSLRNGDTTSCGCFRKEVRMLPFGIAAFNRILGGYKRDAKKSNREFSLSKEQFAKLINGNCFYCGCTPYRAKITKEHNGDYIYNGIDRIDSSKGYTNKNTVSCCWKCNSGKKEMSKKEFFLWVEQVYKYSIQKRN